MRGSSLFLPSSLDEVFGVVLDLVTLRGSWQLVRLQGSVAEDAQGFLMFGRPLVGPLDFDAHGLPAASRGGAWALAKSWLKGALPSCFRQFGIFSLARVLISTQLLMGPTSTFFLDAIFLGLLVF